MNQPGFYDQIPDNSGYEMEFPSRGGVINNEEIEF